jgi:hypothetical protein
MTDLLLFSAVFAVWAPLVFAVLIIAPWLVYAIGAAALGYAYWWARTWSERQ